MGEVRARAATRRASLTGVAGSDNLIRLSRSAMLCISYRSPTDEVSVAVMVLGHGWVVGRRGL